MTLGTDLDRALAASLSAAADAQMSANRATFGVTALDERLKSDEAEIRTISSRVTKLEAPGPVPVPVPPPAPVVLDIEGPGVRAQSKGNVESNDQKRQAIVFRAKRTGLIDTVQVSLRGNGGGGSYSGGNGGIHRFAFEEYATGIPVGASGSIAPGNPSGAWTTYPRIAVGAPVEAGKLYRCWIDDIDPSRGTNWCSLNHLFNWDGAPPGGRAQARFPAGDWALEVLAPNGSHITADEQRHSPVAAFRYSDGTWQGQGYVGMIGGISTLPGAQVSYGIIGGSKKVRSTWQVTAATSLSTLYVGGIRCQMPADLHLSLWGPAGELDDIICPAIATSTPGGDNGGSVHVGGKLPKGRLAIPPGAYQVRLSSTGLWSAAPIREGTEYGFDPSVCWSYGKFQVTSDGSTFSDPYAGLDLQWWGER